MLSNNTYITTSRERYARVTSIAEAERLADKLALAEGYAAIFDAKGQVMLAEYCELGRLAVVHEQEEVRV